MTKYWCVNFDSEYCLKHGIERSLWMMQYQYEDAHGNIYQGGRQKSATTTNWRRLKKINAGDWFVAYLPKDRTTTGNAFYAIGQVVTPRRSPTSKERRITIEEYIAKERSHDIKSGFAFYTDAPVFYEDFTDKWRSAEFSSRYAQRIDVEEWQHFAPEGVPWINGLKIPPNEIQRAYFSIPKRFFDQILTQLSGVDGLPPMEQGYGVVDKVTEDALVEILEKRHAKGQGFQPDSKLRKELEDYAMKEAKQHFRSQGYVVKDHSKNQPYDLVCTKQKETLFVEVKGTQTAGESVFLTSGEVEFAHKHQGQMALFLLHSITVTKKNALTKGQSQIIEPWDVEHGSLKPITYKYTVPSRSHQATSSMLEVVWRKWEHRPTEGFGHGVEFHDSELESELREESLVGFLEGFAWYHGQSDEAIIYCIKPNSHTTEAVLSGMKQRIEGLLAKREIPNGQITMRIKAHVNG